MVLRFPVAEDGPAIELLVSGFADLGLTFACRLVCSSSRHFGGCSSVHALRWCGSGHGHDDDDSDGEGGDG